MAHSSHPIFLDHPPYWHQSNQPQASNDNDPRQIPAFLAPPPPPTASHGGGIRPGSMAYRARLAMIPQPEGALKCPRCDSTNTKFCYFNNYSLSQPRHFCKTCRRYWTRGGALRNVPVGGGFRKNKKKKKSNRSKSPTPTQTQMGNPRSIGGAINSTSCNIESTTMSHFPSQPLQLPSIPSLQQHLSRFANNSLSPNVVTEFHLGNLNSGREADQWQRLQQQQQQSSFVVAGLEPPTSAATLYPQNLQTQVNNFGTNSSSSALQYNFHQQLQNLTLPFSRIPMKNEEQNQNQIQNQEHQGILSNFLRPADQNNQFWGGDHQQNSWTDLSALSSSSSSHLL